MRTLSYNIEKNTRVKNKNKITKTEFVQIVKTIHWCSKRNMMLSEIHLPKSRVFWSAPLYMYVDVHVYVEWSGSELNLWLGNMSEVLFQQIKRKRKIAEIINKSISSFFFITNMKKHPNEEIRILEVWLYMLHIASRVYILTSEDNTCNIHVYIQMYACMCNIRPVVTTDDHVYR